MEHKELLDYCLSFPKAYSDYPFGEEPVCLKVNGKIFAEIYFTENNDKLTLKSEAMMSDFYRRQYPSTVVRGYHCPASHQPYWNTVSLNKDVPDAEVFRMIGDSYRLVVKTFSKRIQAEIEQTE